VIRAALLAAALAPALALAAAPARVVVAEAKGRLVAAVDLAPAIPAGLERQLGNGLTNVIAIHVALLPARGGQPAAVWAREVQVLYDVWDEAFGVLVRDPSTPRGRRLTFETWPELRAWLADLRGVALGTAEELEDATWVLQARVEVNPLSKELLDRTRELIANPAAGARGGPSRSVLGAMASYLLREPPAGAEVSVLRSAPLTAADVRRP
jgi:hypothetical protein